MTEIARMINDRLGRIENNQNELSKQLGHLSQNGCSKADGYKRIEDNQGTIFDRLLQVELSQAEGRGRLAIGAAIAGALLATAFAWIGRHLP
jgi:hypothetical protein